MTIEHLFSSPLYTGKFKKHEEYKNKLLPLLLEDIFKSKDKNKHDEWWSCNSYQTFLWGHGQEEIQNEMFEHVDNYMNELGYSEITYRMSSSWFNMYGANQYQEEHSHLPELFSGLYVMKFDPEIHKGLVFTNKHPELAVIHSLLELRPKNFSNAYTDNYINLEEGNVYIFPSSLRHLVPPQPANLDKDNYRITFTFNVAI